MTIIAFIMLVFSSFTAWYFWDKSTKYKSIVSQCLHRLQRAKTVVEERDAQQKSFKKQIQDLKKQSLLVEQKLKKSQNQLLLKSAELIEKQELIKSMNAEHQSKIENLNEQTKAMSSQFQESIQEKRSLQQKLQDSQLKSQKNANIDDLKKKYLESKNNLQQTHAKLSDFEKKYKNIEPKEHFSLKKRCAEYSRLYAGMRSLKEMSDYQNKNFQTALIHLSKWTLDKIGAQVPKTESIGELVGEALEKTGGTFIDDSESSALPTSNQNNEEIVLETPDIPSPPHSETT